MSSEEEKGGGGVYENTNGMPLAAGKNLHMDTGPGDMANRIINVGSRSRAVKISQLLDDPSKTRQIDSARGFTTFTGTYKGVEVSVVSIGMGVAMMDFFVRESRAVISGPILTIRYGTCGGLGSAPSAGAVIVADGAGLVTRNPDAFTHLYGSGGDGKEDGSGAGDPYRMSLIAPSDAELTAKLSEEMQAILGAENVKSGINVTADSFYSSQGRIDDRFGDENKDVIQRVRKHYGDLTGNPDAAQCMEMECFQLLHLAHCAKAPHSIRASSAAIVVADRHSGTVIGEDALDRLEREGGRAVLNALVAMSL